MPKYRTINKCCAQIHEDDKDSAITTFFIRKLCNNNAVKFIKAGNKVLVDYDSLIECLKNYIKE